MRIQYFSNYELNVDAKIAGVEYVTNPKDVIATVQQQSKNEDDRTLYFVDMDKDDEFIRMGHWNIYCDPKRDYSMTIFRHMVPRLLEGAEDTGRGPDSIVGFIRRQGMCLVFTDDISKCDELYKADNGTMVETGVLPLDKFDHYFKIMKENESIFNPYFFIISDKYYLSHIDLYPRKTWCDKEDLFVFSMGVPCYNIPEEVDECIEEDVKWDGF